jgi:hypothetical protein
MLSDEGIAYVRECRLPNSRTRVDFKVSGSDFIECKVSLNAGQVNEFIGQAIQYRAFANRVILCIPSDVQIRADLHTIITELGVTVCNENGLGEVLVGRTWSLPSKQITPQVTVRFTCKCCGSSEKRRHRMNSYCIDCAPRIPHMTFDSKTNRWVDVRGNSCLSDDPQYKQTEML